MRPISTRSRELITEGTRKANRIGDENLERIKEKMHILI